MESIESQIRRMLGDDSISVTAADDHRGTIIKVQKIIKGQLYVIGDYTSLIKPVDFVERVRSEFERVEAGL